MMVTAVLYSFAACAVSIVLERIFSGKHFARRLAELRMPRYAPPLWGWVVIGMIYYAICFTLLYRLLSAPSTRLREWAVAALIGLMIINALWNYFFFQTRNLFHAYLMSLACAVLAGALFGFLLPVDRWGAVIFLPYVLYMPYALAFAYRTWKLNEYAD